MLCGSGAGRKETRMSEILEACTRFLDDDGWPCKEHSEEPLLLTGYQGKHLSFGCCIRAHEDRRLLMVYSLAPEKVPKERRAAMAEFITRANYRMIIGNFEMDLDDGEVRYKTSIDLTGVTLTETVIKRLLYTNTLTFDRYLPAIIAVANNDADPVEALRPIEQ